MLGFSKYIHLVYLPIYFDLFIVKLLFLKYMGSLSKSDPKFEEKKEYILHSKEINAYKFLQSLRDYLIGPD